MTDRVSRRAVADAIRADIRAGRWQVGEQVPSTAAFADEYKISARTATEALLILVNERWLVSRNGVGRFVPESQQGPDR